MYENLFTMKRLVSIALVVLLAFSAHAQSTDYDWQARRHDLSITGGYMSGIYPFRTLIINIASSLGDNGGSIRYYGNYGLQYHYQALWWLQAGVKAQWEGDGYDFYDRADEAKTTIIGQTSGHCASLMASCRFTYLNRRHVKLYSGLDFGLGMYFLDKTYREGYVDSDGNSHTLQAAFLPAFNLTVFGTSFGGERVYGLAELNLGYDALLTLGIGCHI